MEADGVDAAFALGPDGLPGIRFDDARRNEFESICDDLIQRALEEHNAFHTTSLMDHRWKLLRQRDALSVYRHRTPVPPLAAVAGRSDARRSTSRSSLMMGSGFLPGTLNDTMLGVYCDTTETMRIVKSILSDKFIDGSMVHVFEKNSIRAPIIFSGIKWWAMQCPGGQLTHDRDVLCYERMGRIVDTEGNYFAYHVLQSVDLPEWPANRSKLRRAYLSMCYLYRQVNDKWVGCFMLGDYDPASSLPQSLMDMVVSDIMLSVGNVLECAQAKQFSMLMLQNAKTPPTEGRHCTICLASPRLFTSTEKSLQWCVGCQRRVCRRCRLSCKVFRLSMRSRRPKKEWFCRECVGQVIVGPPRRNDWAEKENHEENASYHSSPVSQTSNADSVRSDQEAKLNEMDMEALAELAQQWSIEDNQSNGLVWNAEELARLSGRLNSSRGKRRAESQSKQKMDNPSLLSRSMIGGSSSSSGGRKSIFSVPFLKRSSSLENMHMQEPLEERVDPNFVPGNSYSGGTESWRARAARLNASVSSRPRPPGPPGPQGPPSVTHSAPSRKYSNASSATSSNTSSTNRPQRRGPPPNKAQSDEEMKKLYMQFMETMAKNRAEREGGEPAEPQPAAAFNGSASASAAGGGGAGRAGDDPILQTRLVFDPKRNEYVRVPMRRGQRVPAPREVKCFSIDELD